MKWLPRKVTSDWPSYLGCAVVAALLLSMAAPSIGGFMGRVMFVALIGLFVGLLADLANWNWMNYPLRFSLEMAADRVVSAALMGLVLGAIIKKPSGGP